MEPRSVFLVAILILGLELVSSESDYGESVDYYNGTSFPPPYDLTSTTSYDGGYEDVNASTTDSIENPYTPKGLVDDSEEENLQNQATTTAAPVTYPPAPASSANPSATTAKPRPTIPSNTTSPPSPGFSTPSSGDDGLGNKGNGQGQGTFPANPSPAGPVPGSPINDGMPGGGLADGPDGPSTCLCLALCLTQTPGPQAPPGNGPCVSICACVGASTQSGTPSPGAKDVPGMAPPSPPLADIPVAGAAAAGTDTAQSAVQDGTAVAASQAPPPPSQ